MVRRQPESHTTGTPSPYATLFRAHGGASAARPRTAGKIQRRTRGRAASQFDPRCDFTPERKGSLTIVISVTRSAASISASGALRSVMITCFISAWAATNFQHFVHRHIVLA